MKHRLWLMSGIPGSGKSTWVKTHKNYFSEKHEIISRDQIRFALVSEDEEYFSKEKEVWAEFVNRAKLSLENNIDTILDATHLNEGSRAKILRALAKELEEVEINVIVVNNNLDLALLQNENRKGTRSYVPRGVIRRMFYQSSLPTLDEGFDHIYIYTKENGKVKYEIIE